MKGSRLC